MRDWVCGSGYSLIPDDYQVPTESAEDISCTLAITELAINVTKTVSALSGMLTEAALCWLYVGSLVAMGVTGHNIN